MAHMIEKFDRGFVWGTTWHELPQYTQLDRPVTPDEARSILAYRVRRTPLYRRMWDTARQMETREYYRKVEAVALFREDHPEIVLVPHVGPGFVPVDNLKMFDHIWEAVGGSGLQIESVGTLRNGATAFVNLVVEGYHLKHDQAETKSRLMWFNPLGIGAIGVCAHTIRVVCNNTLRAAWRSGKAGGTAVKVVHKAGAEWKAILAARQIAEGMESLKELRAKMDFLADIDLTEARLKAFLDGVRPLPQEEGKARTIAQRFRNEVVNVIQYNKDQFDHGKGETLAAAVQAVTYVYDHQRADKRRDRAAIIWSGLVGNNANAKDRALAAAMSAASL